MRFIAASAYLAACAVTGLSVGAAWGVLGATSVSATGLPVPAETLTLTPTPTSTAMTGTHPGTGIQPTQARSKTREPAQVVSSPTRTWRPEPVTQYTPAPSETPSQVATPSTPASSVSAGTPSPVTDPSTVVSAPSEVSAD